VKYYLEGKIAKQFIFLNNIDAFRSSIFYLTEPVTWFNSSQDCFKATWSSHKSVHREARLPALRADSPEEQISAALSRGWLYCLKKGQSRTSRLPYFDWLGCVYE
jgi:uncharacterized protein YhjY with autotransporter beta-barrel domain